MKKNILLPVAVTVAIALCTVSCGVKDPIYNTEHPDHGTITLTTDWRAIDKNIKVPESYTVKADGFSATLSGVTNMLDYLFDPGSCHLRVYNTPEHIAIDEATATVAQASGNADGAGQFVQEMPDWLFTSTQDVKIEADTDHAFTATMQQQVRQLTLLIEPTGSTAGEIEHIEGYLSGAAATLDFDKGEHGTPLNVELSFTKVTSGDNVGKWVATVRLLGIAGSRQELHALIVFTDGSLKPLSLSSDLSAELATFNADKATPLTLGGTVVETPTDVGFGATITDWVPVIGGPVIAK